MAHHTAAAPECPFCAQHTADNIEPKGLRCPDAVIPFKITKEEARDKITAYSKRMPLLPKPIKEQLRAGNPAAFYVPHWLFNGTAQAVVQGRTQQIQRWSDAYYNYTKTDSVAIERRGQLQFLGVPVDGSSRLDDKLMQGLEPFDYRALIPFDPDCLIGHVAGIPDMDPDTLWQDACKRLERDVAKQADTLVKDVGTLANKNVQVAYAQTHAQQALLPVWIVMGYHNEKTYYVAVNGQSGKIAADLPSSAGSSAALFFGTAAALTAIFSALSLLGVKA